MSAPPKSRELSAADDPDWTRGILNPGAEGERFRLARFIPAPELSMLVDRYWSVRWQLVPGDSYISETMPYPSVNVVFEPGDSAVNGIFTQRWSRRLAGTGRVFAVKFLPGAFAPFFARPIQELTDRRLPIAEVFGGAGDELAEALLAESEDEQRARVFEAFLSSRLPPPDPERARVAEIVQLALRSERVRRVDALADVAGVSTRALQRLFQRYLGVSPKWMLCRFRIQEAAQRVAQGLVVDWAALASELGYFDQAHFSSDFKAQIGKTPGEYAAMTRQAGGRERQG